MVFQNFNLFFKEDSASECNGGADRGKEDEKRGSRKDCERELKKCRSSGSRKPLSETYVRWSAAEGCNRKSTCDGAKTLLLDEPTSALDPELVGEVLDTIKKANEGYTMLLVSHEMNFVRNVATRVIFLDGGKILEDGTPREVFGNQKNERVKEFFAKINRGWKNRIIQFKRKTKSAEGSVDFFPTG